MNIATDAEADVVTFTHVGRVLTATLNRPKALNALTSTVERALLERLIEADQDPTVGCIVIAGNERAFAAGADIKELQKKTYLSMHAEKTFSGWDHIAKLDTPKVAAVAGYALGGGCELAMMCDIVIAAESAKFGQPELRLGLIPGMGGTQRLTRLVGRAKAMDMILTGRMVTATEADKMGLVSRVVPSNQLDDVVAEVAETIAGFGTRSVMAARHSVAYADQVGLAEGLQHERHNYYALFDTPDAIEGMAAFVDKRTPSFGHQPE